MDDRYLTKEVRADYPRFIGQERELSAGSARLKREYEERDELNRQAREDAWAEQSTKQDLEAESSWQSAGFSDCRTFGSKAEPELCINLQGPSSRELGTPITYRVLWRNLPKNTYIRVWVVNAAPAGERWKYLGPAGAISVPVLGSSQQGDMRLTWDGRSNTCAPADLPMLCDNGQIGTYVLRAAVLTGTDPFHVGWPERHPVPTRYWVRSETLPFMLTGSPQLDAFGPIREAIDKVLPAGVREPWAAPVKLGPWKKTWLSYCSRTRLKWPMAGSIVACLPHSSLDRFGVAIRAEDILVKSDARLAPGIMRMEDARARATAYGIKMAGKRATFPAYPGESDLMRALGRDPKTYDGGYQQLRNDARDAGLSYVDVNQPYPTLRMDASNSWWLVTFGLRIVKIDGPGGTDLGRVALRIDHDGHVCRVQQVAADRRQRRLQREAYSPCLLGSRKLVEL